ncbi:transmembrane protein 70, mitochondrial [Alosa alosa]|uniref:transmembrane protein 70, mitochondrial n=1 Tax=Alosa alosa TaxID=278164 RepID=UPI0020153ACF|nr:transmembrane protein 70, mitochondrial [Alosa alosa]
MYHVRLMCGLRSFSQYKSQLLSNYVCAQVSQNVWNRTTSAAFKRMFVTVSRNAHQRLLLTEGLQRSITSTERNKISQQNTVRYASAARPSEDGRLVYSGEISKSVLGVKFFSYSCSMFSICAMPYVLMKTGLGVQSLPLQVAFCGVIGFFTFITPVLLHLVTKGYVVRLYHNEGTDLYTAVTYNALLAEKKTVFHQSDVKVPEISKMFTTFYAKNHSMLVNPDSFTLPHDYNHLMGYDQPFTFEVDDHKPDKK